MQDGRSAPPPPPDEITDVLTCAAINKFLGTHYTIEQVQDMPDDFVTLLRLTINATNG